jgi:transcriptional regulator of nitric oxide reductase
VANDDNATGAGEQLAQWLKEAGRRAQHAAPAAADSDDTYNSPASLLHYVEELAGRPMRSHTEVLAFLQEVAGSRPVDHRMAERRRMVRELSLLGLLMVSYLHFYYWEVQLQIAALNSVRTFLPSAATPQPRKT